MSLSILLEELRSTSKPGDKQEILLNHDSWLLRHVIQMTYDPFVLFNIKLKKSEVPDPGASDFEQLILDINALLDFCAESKSPKQNRERAIKVLSKLDTGSQELLLGILNKDWKVGLGVKLVLKAFPGIVPLFEVQLANKYQEYLKKKGSQKNKSWYRSPKLDGVRCAALRNGKDPLSPWRFYSRQGKRFLTVEHLQTDLEQLYTKLGYTFFDGELYKHGMLFEEVQGAVMAFTKGQAPDIEYHIFIAGNQEDFWKQSSASMSIACFQQEGKVVAVDSKLVPAEEIPAALEDAFAAGYEGIMLRDPDNLYAFKRSDALLKLKESENKDSQETVSDCYVLWVEYKDDFPVIVDGCITYERLINKLHVLQDDNIECTVGSKMTLDFRRQCTANPELILGQVVEIKHQGYGTNGRMRFPRLERVRYDLTWSGPEPYEEV